MIRPVLLFCFVALLFIFGVVASAQETVIPDGEIGLALFGERCVNCHGPSGMGDGPMATQLAVPPVAFADPAYLRQAIPNQMLTMITNGDLARGMPPFGPENSDPIAETEQWHLVAAVYSLGTPAGAIEQGQATYQATCQECHGQTGLSEGLDLSGRDYWFQRSNQAVFDILNGQTIAEHQYSLSQDDLWFVVDYARSLSYRYSDPLLAFAPLASAMVTGNVVNGTTQTSLAADTQVTLTAFDENFQPTLTLTTTLDADGNYQFELTDVLPEWAYLATVHYAAVNFGSESGQLSRAAPTLALPITVYEPSSDASQVTIDQLHIILEFSDGLVQVNELYQFSQNDLTVFVGSQGDVTQGTVQISLPAGVTAPTFSRSFGSLDSFFPATDLIQTANGWADVVPLRPGLGTLSLLVRYNLPYDDSLDLSHNLQYNSGGVNLVMPDVGVSLANEAEWVNQGAQVISEGAFVSFTRGPIPAGEALTISLSGQPDEQTSSNSNSTLIRNQNQELLIGGVALAFSLAGAVYLWQRWQQVADETAEGDSGRDELLQAIADLDDAFAAGEIAEEEYGRQRQGLKAQLAEIWHV